MKMIRLLLAVTFAMRPAPATSSARTLNIRLSSLCQSLFGPMKIILPLVLLMALTAGCGKEGSSFVSKTGAAVGEQLTDFTKGVGKGIDQRMIVEVGLSPEVQALGLSNTIAKSIGLDDNKPGISIYFIAWPPAHDLDRGELWPSRAEASFQAGAISAALATKHPRSLDRGCAKREMIIQRPPAAELRSFYLCTLLPTH